MEFTRSADAVTDAAQPQQVVISLFGLYGRRFDELLPIADIIELMSDLGMEPAGVRSVISRLKRRGILISGRHNGVAAYKLAPELTEIFAEGDERIFHPQRAHVDDPWLLVSFSVPESQRNLRHRLRSLLSRLGFGVITSGLWVGPSIIQEALIQELNRTDLMQFTKIFRSVMIGDEDMKANVRQWWDLPTIASTLRDFIKKYKSLSQHRSSNSDFAVYLNLVTDWRKIPYSDPGLPLEFLPDDWPGETARKLFLERHHELSAPALARASSVLGPLSAE